MNKVSFSVIAFAVMVFIGTGFDYLIHVVLYRFGLQYYDSWFVISQVLYFLFYQAVIWILYYFNRNVYFLILTQAFVWTGTQDLVFFGLWNMGVFPEGQWTWIGCYRLWGIWTTEIQLWVSFLGLQIAGWLCLLINRLRH